GLHRGAGADGVLGMPAVVSARGGGRAAASSANLLRDGGRMEPTAEVLDRIFREEAGRVLATLIRQVRDFELAEDVLQDACAMALETWPTRGVPESPRAWLIVTARRKAIDRLRRETALASRHETLAELTRLDERDEEDTAIQDDRLRLIFTCCHP